MSLLFLACVGVELVCMDFYFFLNEIVGFLFFCNLPA